MPTFGGVTGRCCRKAWRVPAVVALHGFGEHSGPVPTGSGTPWTAPAPTVGATRSAMGSPRATSGFGRASFEFANSARLHSAIGHVPPAEYEAAHYAQTQPQPAAEASTW